MQRTVGLMQEVRAKNEKISCDQKKASGGVDRIVLSSPCGEVDPREASASKRQGHGTVLYGKTNQMLLRTGILSRKGPRGTSGTAGKARATTPTQMRTSGKSNINININ